jgi:diguanylate cyclase (GGDEF)-like protein
VALLTGSALAGVAALDWLMGGFAVTMLYLAPVALASWRSGPLSGALWAVVAAAAWLAVELAVRSGTLPAAGWEATVRLATFLVVVAGITALRREREIVRTLAGTDHLTGVHDARSFRELVELERSRALRYDRPFTLAYMDVDGFRTVNEEWGHPAGDQALRLVATTIRDNIRSMDSVCRMGGDEFALLFPETGKGAAQVALNKIQTRLVEATGERSLALTFTIGAVICVGAPESVAELVQRAERLMYGAKEEGGGAIRTEVLDENFGIEAILQRS